MLTDVASPNRSTTGHLRHEFPFLITLSTYVTDKQHMLSSNEPFSAKTTPMFISHYELNIRVAEEHPIHIYTRNKGNSLKQYATGQMVVSNLLIKIFHMYKQNIKPQIVTHLARVVNTRRTDTLTKDISFINSISRGGLWCPTHTLYSRQK